MIEKHKAPQLYANRDIINQGTHYIEHVRAMTAEGLHSKSDIAAELAHRDIAIVELIATSQELLRQRDMLLAALNLLKAADFGANVKTAEDEKHMDSVAALANAAIAKAEGGTVSPQPAVDPAVELYAGLGEPLFPVEPKSPESGVFDPNMGNSHITQCQCKDRPARECPGAWEPGCSLGNRDAHAVAVVQHLPADDTEGGAA